MLYSYYRSIGKRCKLLLGSKVCSKYTHLGQSYNVAIDTIFNRLLDKAARLEDAEVAKEEVLRKKAAALYAAQAKLDKSIAQLDRLRKQKKIVFQKG
ncbi:hypothetical protein GQ607_016865 [Colletotrichum asianum]|uniref:Uncharacterized protein n=1 Tax=Colletotrichum asianum TaxID=702518 RepID=A0A8H3W060_9PEZI|nr:hypothetical protein GQ607_016865 [Colletotrichum asianum]